MKFRGKMTDTVCIHQFTGIVNLLARITKTAIFHIAKDKLFFITAENSIDCASLFIEILQERLFNEFNMEGVSSENDDIFLEFPTAHVRLVVHDVPVTLIPRRLWHLYQEPEMPDFDVSLYLPPFKQLKHVIERMKALSSQVSLTATKKGYLIVSVSNETVQASTHFKNLSIPILDKVNNQNNDDNTSYAVTVDIKKFALFLQNDQFYHGKVLCNIGKSRIAHILVLHDDTTMQYFLPAVIY